LEHLLVFAANEKVHGVVDDLLDGGQVGMAQSHGVACTQVNQDCEAGDYEEPLHAPLRQCVGHLIEIVGRLSGKSIHQLLLAGRKTRGR
jgi:hypothetical protein